MNQKKAKAIRREMRKLHGHTKANVKGENRYKSVDFQPIAIFTEGKFKRVLKKRLAEKMEKLQQMGAEVPRLLLVKRIVAELPAIGTLFKNTNRTGTAIMVFSSDARRAYKGEKKFFNSLKKKQRAGRYEK